MGCGAARRSWPLVRKPDSISTEFGRDHSLQSAVISHVARRSLLVVALEPLYFLRMGLPMLAFAPGNEAGRKFCPGLVTPELLSELSGAMQADVRFVALLAGVVQRVTMTTGED